MDKFPKVLCKFDGLPSGKLFFDLYHLVIFRCPDQEFYIAVRGNVLYFDKYLIPEFGCEIQVARMDESAKLRIKVHEHAEVCMTLYFSLVGLSNFKLARIAFGTEDMHKLFFGTIFTEIPLSCGLYAAHCTGYEFSASTTCFAGFGNPCLL